MKQIRVTIEGVSALLMHAFPMVPVEALEKKSIEDQAECAAYRDAETKRLYIPALNLQRSFISGATYSKGKGRGSLQKNAAACLSIGPTDRLDLGIERYVIDSRPVVVPATKGRVLRHRPKVPSWRVTFEVQYDELLLSAAQVRRIIDDTGSRVGVLDFRPEKKGPFGRFIVTHWDNA
ncbi:MAG: hypothetical protein ACREJC_23135 [Tepidisphaeraceae bacterium]